MGLFFDTPDTVDVDFLISCLKHSDTEFRSHYSKLTDDWIRYKDLCSMGRATREDKQTFKNLDGWYKIWKTAMVVRIAMNEAGWVAPK